MIVNMRGVWELLPKVGALCVVFAGTVGAVDRIRCNDGFSPIPINTELDQRVGDYVDLVSHTRSALKPSKTEPKKLRKLANEWLVKSRAGKLKTIFPGYCGESLIEGPKGSIFNSCAGITTRLSELAEREAEKGNPQAFNDAITAIELMNIVRYGNYETLFTAGNYLRRPMRLVQANIDKLTPEQKKWLTRVQDPKVRDQRTQELATIAQRLRVQYQTRYGTQMAMQDDINYAFFLGKKGGGIAANHFYGFDRETKLISKLNK